MPNDIDYIEVFNINMKISTNNWSFILSATTTSRVLVVNKSTSICLNFDYRTTNWQVFDLEDDGTDTTGDWVTGITSFYMFYFNQFSEWHPSKTHQL